jgi:hypothetical protein
MEPTAISEQYAKRVSAAIDAAERVPPKLRESKGVTENWSVKDLLGHCAYWDGVHAAEMETEFAGGTILEDDREDDVINAEQFEIRANWSWDKIMDEVTTNRDRLVELLKRPSRYDQSGSGEHWIEHRQQIEDWLARNQSDRTGHAR